MDYVLECVISVLGLAAAYAVCLLTEKVASYIKSKLKVGERAELLSRAVEAVSVAVKTTAQTYVDTLKKEGLFGEEAQKAAFNAAKATAYGLLTDGVKEAITQAYGDIDAYLGAKIEAEVAATKNK